MTGHQHIQALEHAIRISAHTEPGDQQQPEGDPTQQTRPARGLRFDGRQRGALQLALKVQLRELCGAHARIVCGLLGQCGRAQRAFTQRPIDGHEHAPNRTLHVAEVAPIARASYEDLRDGQDQQERGPRARPGRTPARQEPGRNQQ